MTSSLHVSLPDEMRAFVDMRANGKNQYTTPSEYVRALIREADPAIEETVKWRKPTNPAGVQPNTRAFMRSPTKAFSTFCRSSRWATLMSTPGARTAKS